MSRRPPPTLDDLLVMVADAAVRPLRTEEVSYLRNALHLGDAARRSSGGLQEELRRARRDLRLAEDELQTLRAPKPPPATPIGAYCGRCQADPGTRCHGPYGTDLRGFHSVRIHAAQEASR